MTITLYLANGTKSASFFMLCRRQTPDMKASRKLGVWIPKSLCKIISRDPEKPWTWPKCEVEIPDWFARREKLEDRIAHVQEHHVKKP